ncbi:MAG: MCE family protein [Bacteroidetes bacterium]|nr:MCE family protein [Bacteroidota bacterium]
MAKQTISNIKLGAFVTAGLLVLIYSLYTIGKNSSYFGGSFRLRARFHSVNGLMKGNNVRFSGIQAGNVKDISIISDTLIEVTMVIDENTKKFIRKNALVSIGSEGLMGNKVVNIEPNSLPAPLADDNDILLTANKVNLDNMLATLDKTNMNLVVISEDLKETMHKINNSKMLWTILDDTTLSSDIRNTFADLRKAGEHINTMAANLDGIITQTSNGDGTLGLLLKDTATANRLKHAIIQVNNASDEMNAVTTRINNIVTGVQDDLSKRDGIVSNLLRDTAMTNQLRNSLNNIEKGTASFDEDMKALQHNFLLRRYFKKKEKEKKH